MGTSYGRNVSQWSKGEYYLANNTEDDLAIISGKITYRPDDRGNTAGTATPLVISGLTNVVSTTPESDPPTPTPPTRACWSATRTWAFLIHDGHGMPSLTVKPWIMPSASRAAATDARRTP